MPSAHNVSFLYLYHLSPGPLSYFSIKKTARGKCRIIRLLLEIPIRGEVAQGTLGPEWVRVVSHSTLAGERRARDESRRAWEPRGEAHSRRVTKEGARGRAWHVEVAELKVDESRINGSVQKWCIGLFRKTAL